MRDRGEVAIENGLRAARLAAGLSQGELATRAGTTRQTISALESGAYAPTMAVGLRLARELGRDVATPAEARAILGLPTDGHDG